MKINKLIVSSVMLILLVSGTHYFSTISHAEDITIELKLWDDVISPGDYLTMEAYLWNPGEELVEAAMCVLLEIDGAFWCWPSWRSLDTGFDYKPKTIGEGRTIYWVMDYGPWPDIPPAGIDLYFWGALLDTGLTKLLGPYDRVSWTY